MEKILDDVRRDAVNKLMSASEEDKSPLKDAAVLMMKYCLTGMEEGNLALKGAACKSEDEYLKNMIMLIADGAYLENIVEIATNVYWMRNPQGVLAMTYYIYMRGMVCIVRKDNYEKTKLLLQTLLPQNEKKDFEKEIEEKRAQHKKMILDKFDAVHPVFQNPALQVKLHELEEEFTVKIIHDKDVQRVLQDSLNCCKLELCVYGLGDEARDRIFQNLSARNAFMLKEDVVLVGKMEEVKEDEILKEVENMLSLIAGLRDRGEIYS